MLPHTVLCFPLISNLFGWSFSDVQDMRYEPDGMDDENGDPSDDDDDERIVSFVALLGVEGVPAYREAAETDTDQSRITDQTHKSEGFKATNAAMLDGLNLDTVEEYDDAFLRLWDMDAGREMLSYMARQTASYVKETAQLDRENGALAATLNELRRRKQDGYFQVQDLEVQAADAEKRHRQLAKLRPKRWGNRKEYFLDNAINFLWMLFPFDTFFLY